MKLILQALSLLLLMQTQGFAKAYFFSEAELVRKSHAIAIIDLEEPTAAKVKGKTFSYDQVARATVVEAVSGEIPTTFQIHGMENFICARCQLSKGRYLAFLVKEGDLWVGANWQLSLRPVKDGKIEWYSKAEERFPQKFQDSKWVLDRIRSLLAARKTAAS